MAKKPKQTLAEKITKQEVAANELFTQYKQGLVTEKKLDAAFAKLQALYEERNVESFDQALAFNPTSYDSMSLTEKIAEVERQALDLHKALAEGKRVALPTWQLDTIVMHLNVRLDYLNQELYVERWKERMLEKQVATTPTQATGIKFLGPEKLNSRKGKSKAA